MCDSIVDLLVSSRLVSFRLCRLVVRSLNTSIVLRNLVMARLPYDPLPLTTDDLPAIALYNSLPSPDPHVISRSASSNLPEHPPEPLPLGSSRPRFLGPALYEDLSHPRDSFASSLPSPTGGSDYTSSLYALNDPGTSPYRDDFPSGTVPMSPTGPSRFLEEKNATYDPPRSKSHRIALLLIVLAALIIVIVAVVVPIYFIVIKPKTSAGSRLVNTSPTMTASATPTPVVTGGDGSIITMEDGTTFTYSNKFGGYWYFDENDPFNNGARAQSWTPALNETFNYGIDKIRG